MNKDNSFGVLRLIAALMVTLSHSFPLALGPGVAEPPYPLLPFSLGTVGVYIFFAISGILVTQSFLRTPSALRFAWHRFLRIYPALFVCMALTIFVAAPLFATSSAEVFGSWTTYRSFIVNVTLIKDVEVGLAGVFSGNPLPSAINNSIWTLVWEVRAYLLLFLLGPILRVRHHWLGLVAILVGIALSPLAITYSGREPQFLGVFFLAGLLWYLNQNLRYRPIIAGVATLLMIATYGSPFFDLAFATWIAAMVFTLGTIRTRAFRVFERFDPTYGLYLYSWPVGQILVATLGIGQPILLAGLTVLVAGCLATLSWYVVERPAMRLKNWNPLLARN